MCRPCLDARDYEGRGMAGGTAPSGREAALLGKLVAHLIRSTGATGWFPSTARPVPVPRAGGSVEGKESMMDRVQIFDTRLRDGEQSPGATMNVEEKLAIARQLEHLGVDVIEAGFAASSEGDFEAVRRVAEAVSRPLVLSLARTREQDVDRAVRAVERANGPGIPIFIATSAAPLKDTPT